MERKLINRSGFDMKIKKNIMFTLLLLALSIVLVACGESSVTSSENGSTTDYTHDEEQITKIDVAWQYAWPTQAHLGSTLINTNVLSLNDLSIEDESLSFAYGAPVVEALLAGEGDIGFVGDVPAVNLIARGAPFTIVSKLLYFGGGLVTTDETGIETLGDLAGKNIAVPFGSTVHGELLDWISEAGIEDVNVINLGASEHAQALQQGDIDASMTWDPFSLQILDMVSNAKLVKGVDDLLGVIIMSNDFIENDREAAIRFMMAAHQSFVYISNNKDETDQWVHEISEMDLSLIRQTSSIDPNYLNGTVLGDINLSLSDADVETINNRAIFLSNEDMIDSIPDLDSSIDQSILEEAMQRLESLEFNVEDIN